MPAFPLTATWLKIASAGQAVEIQNLSAAPILITTGTSPPITTDGVLLGALDTRAFALTADLYARAAGAAPGTVEVMGGFTLPGLGGAVPFATTIPVVAGTPQVGQALTASQGAWSGAPTGYAYAWSRNGTAIPGATGSVYTPVAGDSGASLTVTVTATNAAGSATATSPAVTVASSSAPGGGPANTADFSDPNNAYLAALAA